MKTAIVIPARYASRRFPGKPLFPLLGKPMILHVAEIAEKVVGRESTFIATDDTRIFDAVMQAGYKAFMTRKSAPTGTDRIYEIYEQIDADILVDLQGDEPLVLPEDIEKIIRKKKEITTGIVCGATPLEPHEDPSNPNIPKVVVNEENRILYISRAPVPGCKIPQSSSQSFLKQVCIVAFNREEISRFGQASRKSNLETIEDIELLRCFDLNIPLFCRLTSRSSVAVDTKEDIPIVENELKKRLQ